jgi:3'-phosphoadenosine 5'-phosphosulfate sulfotransferase (PAPS reductase)/FAD synthetase
MVKQIPLFTLDTIDHVEREAIDWLHDSLHDKYSLVCFSGGKDSIVTEHLMRLAMLRYSINSTLTGIDPPEVTRFIRTNYPNCSFVHLLHHICHFGIFLQLKTHPQGLGEE